jgi:hypothetical protein
MGLRRACHLCTGSLDPMSLSDVRDGVLSASVLTLCTPTRNHQEWRYRLMIGYIHDRGLPVTVLENDRVSDARSERTMSTHFFIPVTLQWKQS